MCLPKLAPVYFILSLLSVGLALPTLAHAQCDSCGELTVPESSCESGTCGESCDSGSCGIASGGCAAGGCESGGCGGGGCQSDSHCGVPAPSYPVPFATPRPTVYTHFTHPMLMPHNSLHNYQNIYTYRHAQGLSRTQVYWRPSKGVNAVKYLHHLFEWPR